jgi:16S rRNA (uracil1498-N3)-methyltransferase
VERRGRPPVATFYAPELVSSGELSLGAAPAHHASVRRLTEGDSIRVTDGAGRVGNGTIRSVRKGELLVEVATIEQVPRYSPLEVLVPVADRERMLWLAEKCAELAVTVWQPVVFARSRSVVPRGEGEGFAAKVRARMVAALEQSGGAWLPDIRREMPLEDAADAVAAGTRLVLDRDGAPLDAAGARDGAAVAFGPEGGIEPEEHTLLDRLGWRRASLAPTTLRFETAGVAAVAILRAASIVRYAEEG